MDLLEQMAIALDPAMLFAEAVGQEPDAWQRGVLRSAAPRVLLNCSRQSGKSTVCAALALHCALFTPGALVLLLSPSLRQSGELFRKVVANYRQLDRPVESDQETALTLTLANGSRVISLPGQEGTIRGYSGVTLLVIDEAARVEDALYYSLRPMLAVSGGRLVALSTPAGKRGWFYEEWHGTESWERVSITAEQCPRITAEFLAEERRVLGPRWFSQEYLCSFEDVMGSVFSGEALAALLTPAVQAVAFPESNG